MSVRLDRSVDPGGEVDLGVLGRAELADLGRPRGQVESLGLLLEVVEHPENRFLESHACGVPARRRRQTSPVDILLTPHATEG